MGIGRVVLRFFLSFCLQVWFWTYVVIAQQNQGVQASLCEALVSPYPNYQCDEYTVRTDDGFLLGVQRLNCESNGKEPKKPVFLMHGILSGGDTWLLNTPEQSLGFILADAGYDVWIGNIRTTYFSHGHESYTPSDEGYWDWSFNELGEKDVVSMVEVAYKTTNTRMHYIGFSQGTQSALVALSQGMLADWLDKIVLMAPVSFIKHATTPVGILAAKLNVDLIVNRFGIFSLNTKRKSGREYIDILCPASSSRCYSAVATLLTGSNCCLNVSRRPFYDRFETQDTSGKNLLHLGQLYRKGGFRKYDYGATANMQKYNSAEPPEYDLSRIPTSNMFLMYGEKDALADVDDVHELMQQLPPGFKSMYVPGYAHLDFIVGYNANTKVYGHALRFIEE